MTLKVQVMYRCTDKRFCSLVVYEEEKTEFPGDGCTGCNLFDLVLGQLVPRTFYIKSLKIGDFLFFLES